MWFHQQHTAKGFLCVLSLWGWPREWAQSWKSWKMFSHRNSQSACRKELFSTYRAAVLVSLPAPGLSLCSIDLAFHCHFHRWGFINYIFLKSKIWVSRFEIQMRKSCWCRLPTEILSSNYTFQSMIVRKVWFWLQLPSSTIPLSSLVLCD